MRKGFDGLSGLIRSELKMNPESGDVFVFFNGPRTHVKILCWERDGFAIYYKRLEKGTFELLPRTENNSAITAHRLAFILQGVSLSSVKYRKRLVNAA